jgi:hypothetical protein
VSAAAARWRNRGPVEVLAVEDLDALEDGSVRNVHVGGLHIAAVKVEGDTWRLLARYVGAEALAGLPSRERIRRAAGPSS